MNLEGFVSSTKRVSVRAPVSGCLVLALTQGQMEVPPLLLVTWGALTPRGSFPKRPRAGRGPSEPHCASHVHLPSSQDNGNDFGIEHEEGFGVLCQVPPTRFWSQPCSVLPGPPGLHLGTRIWPVFHFPPPVAPRSPTLLGTLPRGAPAGEGHGHPHRSL